jgi:hypothetical protein
MTNLSAVSPELRFKALSANNIELAAKWHLITHEQALDKFTELVESVDHETIGEFVRAMHEGGGAIALAWFTSEFREGINDHTS